MRSLVAASFAFFGLTAAAHAGPGPETFNCSGTEPFWSFKIAANKGMFQSPDSPKPRGYVLGPARNAAGMTPDVVRVFEDKAAGLTFIVRLGKCSDGMSDKAWKYSATLVDRQKVLAGCCEKK
jgi:uncharacterized membrane protein